MMTSILITATLIAACAGWTAATETILDLGLVVQGEEAVVLLEESPKTFTVAINSYMPLETTPINGVQTFYIVGAINSVNTLLGQDVLGYNTGLGRDNYPRLQAAYIYFYDSARLLNEGYDAINSASGFYFNATRPTFNLTKFDLDMDKNKCALKYLPDTSDTRLSNIYQLASDIITTHNVEFAKYSSATNDDIITYTVKEGETAATISAFSLKLAADAVQLYNLVAAFNADILERMHFLQGVTSNLVTKHALDLVRMVPECLETTDLEDVEVSAVRMYDNAVVVNLTVVPFVRAGDHAFIHAVPFMIRGDPYQLEINDPLVIHETSGLVLDPTKCVLTEGNFKCGQDYLNPDPCIQHALDTLVTVPKECRVEKLEPNPIPLIVNTPQGTLVAQRSAHPVRIAHGSSRIRQDPVLVQGPDPLIVTFHKGSKSLEGQPGTELTVHASPWTEEERDSMFYQYNMHYLYKYIPDSYSDYMYLTLFLVQSVLAIPTIWIIIKFMLRCCGVNLDARPPAWLKHLRTWELRMPSQHCQPHMAVPTTDREEEQIPLRTFRSSNVGTAADSFVELARNARTMTLDQFLASYEGNASDLTDFYVRARAGPPINPRRNIQFGVQPAGASAPPRRQFTTCYVEKQEK